MQKGGKGLQRRMRAGRAAWRQRAALGIPRLLNARWAGADGTRMQGAPRDRRAYRRAEGPARTARHSVKSSSEAAMTTMPAMTHVVARLSLGSYRRAVGISSLTLRSWGEGAGGGGGEGSIS